MRTHRRPLEASIDLPTPLPTFTGPVWGEVLLPHQDGTNSNRVTFAAGSRTFWHRHETGQLLIGQAGGGIVVTRDGTVTEIGEGVTVHAEPGEEHWHGALPGSFMTHISVVMCGATEWLEEVGDQDYDEAVERLRSNLA